MNKTYGLLAEFSTHEKLIHAAEEAYAAGFRKMDGFAPFAVEGLAEALGKKNRLPLLVLIGGIIGGIGGYFMEWYANAISYPINIGGRPIHSWPAFVPITFELTVLCAGLTAFFWVACAERSAASLPSALSHSRIRSRVAGPILLMHRSS